MRRVVLLGLLIAGALAAPAGAFPKATFTNQCQYFDPYWRPVPMLFGGRLEDGSGNELVSGSALAVGDVVRFDDGTLSAIMPSWMPGFAYDAGMLPAGDSTLPVRAWLALEATNTAEGVRAPIELNTLAESHIELSDRGGVDESRSWISVRDAPLPVVSWTATGGQIVVRQALGDSLPLLPAGRNGALVRPRGSLYVQVTLTGDGVRLDMDCLQADQVDQGASFTDVLSGALDVFRVPGWSGSSVGGRVDADVLSGAGPVRAGAGVEVVLRDTALRLRLTSVQRDEWLKDATSVSGSVDLIGARSVEGAQTVSFSGPAGDVITVPLPDTRWTAVGDEGIDVRSGSTITLNAGGRPLVLTRVSPGEAYPFARVLRPAPPPPTVRVTPTPTPVPSVVSAPTPVAKQAKVTVRSTKLKVVSRKRVAVALACADAACKGTLSLKTSSGRVLTASARYSLLAGKKATVRLTLSASGRMYLRTHKKVSTRLTVKPSSGTASVKRLTLTR